eukprot:EG_transcript_22787
MDPGGDAKAAKPKDPRLEALKEECLKLYREPPYLENHEDYIIGEFRWSAKKILNVTANQVYRGLADEDDKPHGWGLMQHHNGMSQDCARWVHGVANGRGTFRDPEGSIFYGTWVNGKRDGVGCSITAARHMFVEQYVAGELKAKTKWKIDKEHKQCAHCKGLYVEATNKLECRYHPDGVDWEARGWPPPSHPQ